MEDYAGCEALYANEDTNTLFALYEDKKLKVTVDDKTKDGTYSIQDGIMTTEVDGEKKEYTYNSYQYFTDEADNIYRRIGTCKIIFETGKGSSVETQVLNEENGYQVMKPTDPTLEGNTFEGWYTSDGEKFDFDKIVTKSMTLHAKWSDVEWVSATADINFMPYIWVGITVLLIAVGVVCGVKIIKRGENNETKKEKK